MSAVFCLFFHPSFLCFYGRLDGSAARMGASVRAHAKWQAVPLVEPAGLIELAMDAKRKAISPCESVKFKSTKFSSPNSDRKSLSPNSSDFFSPISEIRRCCEDSSFNSEISEGFEASTVTSKMGDVSMDGDSVVSISYTIDKRDGEPFRGAIDRPMAKKLWEQGFNLPGTLLYGVALNQSTDRAFMVDFELKEAIEWSECPATFETVIDNHKFEGRKFIQRPKAPELGEEVTIRIKKTRFKLKPDQVNRWIEHFGIITCKPDFEDAPDEPTLKSDDIILKAKLRKHVPNLLPAYGRKMTVWYPGQPVVCGKCFEPGHVRKNCVQEVATKWSSYVRLFSELAFVSKEMLGSWIELLKEDHQKH